MKLLESFQNASSQLVFHLLVLQILHKVLLNKKLLMYILCKCLKQEPFTHCGQCSSSMDKELFSFLHFTKWVVAHHTSILPHLITVPRHCSIWAFIDVRRLSTNWHYWLMFFAGIWSNFHPWWPLSGPSWVILLSVQCFGKDHVGSSCWPVVLQGSSE